MPRIVEATVDIALAPEEVFAYVSDPTRLREWQPQVEVAEPERSGIPAVGMRGREVRKVPGGRRTIRWEVTDYKRGRIWAVRGIEGPVRAHVTMTFSPTDNGAGTTFHYRIWFEAHGIGRAIAPLARHGAAGDIAGNLALLKQRLEQPGHELGPAEDHSSAEHHPDSA